VGHCHTETEQSVATLVRHVRARNVMEQNSAMLKKMESWANDRSGIDDQDCQAISDAAETLKSCNEILGLCDDIEEGGTKSCAKPGSLDFNEMYVTAVSSLYFCPLTQRRLEICEETSVRTMGCMDQWMAAVEQQIEIGEELKRRRNAGIE